MGRGRSQSLKGESRRRRALRHREAIAARCRQHGVAWRLVPQRHHGWSDLDERLIETGEILDAVDYYGALHELAHVILDLAGEDRHQDPAVVLDHEARCWLWALGEDPGFDGLVLADVRSSLQDYNEAYRPLTTPASVGELADLLASQGLELELRLAEPEPRRAAAAAAKVNA